jgi:hypothetical protein
MIARTSSGYNAEAAVFCRQMPAPAGHGVSMSPQRMASSALQ